MALDNAAMIPVTTLPLRQLACVRCGMAFACGSGGKAGGCWCMDESLRLPMPAPGEGDCLCPACLRAALSAQAEVHPA